MDLDTAVAQAYEAFEVGKPGEPIDVCLCCVDETLPAQLVRKPLKALSARSLYEYNCSAKNPQQSPTEMAYFLPRMLELIVHGEIVHHSLELSLERLGNTDAASFTPRQHAAVRQIALSHFAASLAQWPAGSGGFAQGSALEYLLMWHRAGVDITAPLAWWLDCSAPAATLHYVTSSWYDYWANSGRVGNPFATDAFQELIDAWMQNAEHRRVFAERMLSMPEWPAGLQQVVEYVFFMVAEQSGPASS